MPKLVWGLGVISFKVLVGFQLLSRSWCEHGITIHHSWTRVYCWVLIVHTHSHSRTASNHHLSHLLLKCCFVIDGVVFLLHSFNDKFVEELLGSDQEHFIFIRSIRNYLNLDSWHDILLQKFKQWVACKVLVIELEANFLGQVEGNFRGEITQRTFTHQTQESSQHSFHFVFIQSKSIVEVSVGVYVFWEVVVTWLDETPFGDILEIIRIYLCMNIPSTCYQISKRMVMSSQL